mgnify:FL=1
MRSEFESYLSEKTRNAPVWQSAVQCTLRLVRNCLDYAAEGSKQVVNLENVQEYIEVSKRLWHEVSHISDASDDLAIVEYWGMVSTWFGVSLATIVESLETTHEKKALLTTALVVWGSFYSRLNLPERKDQADD